MSEIREEFRANALTNEAGDKLRIIRESFSALLVNIETVAPPGRHLALVKTKLEEACMFAVRAVAVEQSNQAAVQVGSECTDRRELRFIAEPIIFHLAKTNTALSVAQISDTISVHPLDEPAAYVVTAPRALHDSIHEAVRLYLPIGVRVDIEAKETALAPRPRP